MVEDDDVNKDDKFEFDSTSEVVEYASLGQSELIAIQDVRNEPGNYGRQYEGVKMGYTVEHQKERADYYVITLLFRPEGDWNGGGGQERFFIEKEGVVAHRQLLSLPRSTSSRRLMSITVLLIVATIVIAGGGSSVIASGIFKGSDDDKSPGPVLAASPPTPEVSLSGRQPTPIATPANNNETAGLIAISPTLSTTPKPASTLAPVQTSPVGTLPIAHTAKPEDDETQESIMDQ